MNYGIYKQTYAGQEAYRYRVVDDADRVHYLAEPTGLLLPNPTRLVTFFDADHNPVGRLEPSLFTSWEQGCTYELTIGGQETPQATIEERWTLVDATLLRLPHYMLSLGERAYVALGNRYAERLYEVFAYSEEEEDFIEELGVLTGEQDDMDEAEIQEALMVSTRRRLGEPVVEIVRPTRGPNYLIEAESASLRQAPLVLASLVIVIDAHLSNLWA